MKHIPSNSVVLLDIPRIAVERDLLWQFLAQYGRDAMPTGDHLASLMDKFVFSFSGFDADSREIYEIPEIRRYMATLHKSWPYLLFFQNLDQAHIRVLIFCLIPVKVGAKKKGITRVGYKRLDLVKYLDGCIEGLVEMCERANLPQSAAEDRINKVLVAFEIK